MIVKIINIATTKDLIKVKKDDETYCWYLCPPEIKNKCRDLIGKYVIAKIWGIERYDIIYSIQEAI